jgi:hypothetical protein
MLEETVKSDTFRPDGLLSQMKPATFVAHKQKKQENAAALRECTAGAASIRIEQMVINPRQSFQLNRQQSSRRLGCALITPVFLKGIETNAVNLALPHRALKNGRGIQCFHMRSHISDWGERALAWTAVHAERQFNQETLARGLVGPGT